MFYDGFGRLEQRFRDYLDDCRESYLVAMFQDEQARLSEHVRFCDEFGVNCVYTMFGRQAARSVYGATDTLKLVSHIPGYVSDELRAVGEALAVPDAKRTIDVGYRGRRPPVGWGAAAQEKYEIAVEFERRAAGSGLVLDIATSEDKRIYGEDWYRFIASCRATLGTESGTEIPWQGETLPYRTISPRHLEAAALRSCQILFEGDYSGLMEPMRHYIPLRKDFSNLDEVLERFADRDLRTRLAENAFRDLIAGDAASYEHFISGFDDQLLEAGLRPGRDVASRRRMVAALRSPRLRRRPKVLLLRMRNWMKRRRPTR